VSHAPLSRSQPVTSGLSLYRVAGNKKNYSFPICASARGIRLLRKKIPSVFKPAYSDEDKKHLFYPELLIPLLCPSESLLLVLLLRQRTGCATQ